MNKPLFLAGLLLSVTVHAQALRDPMRPPLPASVMRSAPRDTIPVLSAVFSSARSRAAIVNGRLVHAGDTLGPFTIEAVLETGIRYQFAGDSFQLQLPKLDTTFKKPTTEPIPAVAGVP